VTAICVPNLVLIAQAVFLLEHGHTDGKETDRRNWTPSPCRWVCQRG